MQLSAFKWQVIIFGYKFVYRIFSFLVKVFSVSEKRKKLGHSFVTFLVQTRKVNNVIKRHIKIYHSHIPSFSASLIRTILPQGGFTSLLFISHITGISPAASFSGKGA